MNLSLLFPVKRFLRQYPLQRRLLSSESSRKVGFVGLGNMGLPMCLNLLNKDNSPSSVIAFDTQPRPVAEAAAKGAQAASSLDQVTANVIFTMLPGDKALDAVLPVLLKNAKDPCVFVDCSTVSPTTSRKWHQQVVSEGHAMLDAPVSGGVKGAQAASLTFMVGCDNENALEIADPLLHLMGKRIIPCGAASTGSATKLCNNLALAAQMLGICEAMNLGESLGVDPVVLADVMNKSTAKCWSCEVNNPHPAVALQTMEETEVGPPASRDYQGGFGTSLMLKDLSLAVAAGQEMGVALPIGTASKELYRMAQLRGLGEKDFGVMLQFLKGK